MNTFLFRVNLSDYEKMYISVLFIIDMCCVTGFSGDGQER